MPTAAPPLACSVRGCGLPLTRNLRTLICAGGHTYDVARSGYVNLLQPQDRRSRTAGDPSSVVAARARLDMVAGMQAITHAFVDRALALPLRSGAVVVDLGAGTGAALGLLAAQRPIQGIGIDLSSVAVEYAARRLPTGTWVVANADRRLPLLDGRVDLVLSLHARRNPAECARILAPASHLLVAVPAPDDVKELRTAVQGQDVERDRVEQLVAEHAAFFEEVDRRTVQSRVTLSGGALRDLLEISYRGGRSSRTGRLVGLESLDVTLASDLCLFRRRGV